MEKMLKIQPLRATEGPELYPFYCDSKGEILHQKFWKGKPQRCIGFVLSSKRFDIAVYFDQVQANIRRIQHGKLLPVFMDKDGGIYTLKEQVTVEFVNAK